MCSIHKFNKWQSEELNLAHNLGHYSILEKFFSEEKQKHTHKNWLLESENKAYFGICM